MGIRRMMRMTYFYLGLTFWNESGSPLLSLCKREKRISLVIGMKVKVGKGGK